MIDEDGVQYEMLKTVYVFEEINEVELPFRIEIKHEKNNIVSIKAIT